jgi:hypothetical protein
VKDHKLPDEVLIRAAKSFSGAQGKKCLGAPISSPGGLGQFPPPPPSTALFLIVFSRYQLTVIIFSQETMPTKADKEELEELRKKTQGFTCLFIIFDHISTVLSELTITLHPELPDDLIRQLNELNTKMKNMINWKDEMINKVDNIDCIVCNAETIKAYTLYININLNSC